MRPFFAKKYPCPECYGNVPWAAACCPHCRQPITASNRFEWLPDWLQPPAFLCLVAAFALAGAKAAGGLVIVWAMLLRVQ